jgi:hypothetical protein
VEHVVFFTGADGAALYRRMPSLEEAVRFVEHLRNVEGVEDSRVYSMTEVPLAFKTVYRVEIPGQTAEAAPAPLPPMPPMPPMPGLEAPVAEVPVEEPAEAPADMPADMPAEAPEPVMAAVPGEPYEVSAEEPSNGRPAHRGMGFFTR